MINLDITFVLRWYAVNYQHGEFLEWGYNSGCTLPTSSCLQYMIEQQSM